MNGQTIYSNRLRTQANASDAQAAAHRAIAEFAEAQALTAGPVEAEVFNTTARTARAAEKEFTEDAAYRREQALRCEHAATSNEAAQIYRRGF